MVTDLNLLRVLDALLTTGSVTTAGARLHLSPSAVSRALGRLRRALDDPLFVQVGREFQPTPRALALRGPTSAALHAAESVLRPATAGDPSTIERTFTISADDALTAGLGGALADDLHAHAPGIALRFVTDDAHDTAIDSGAADLDLGIAPGRTHLRAETLFTDHHVLAAHRANPIHRARSLAAAFADVTVVLVARDHQLRPLLDEHLPPPARSFEVPSYLAAAHLLRGHERAVAVLPSLLVDGPGADGGLMSRALPVQLPVITVSQSWHVRDDRDPTHRWLRNRVRLLASGSTDTSA
jgi:DNA-binding transcriptional LysR family regulator